MLIHACLQTENFKPNKGPAAAIVHTRSYGCSLKKFVFHSAKQFQALFPGSYKGLQTTQKLSCMKHVDLLLAEY